MRKGVFNIPYASGSRLAGDRICMPRSRIGRCLFFTCVCFALTAVTPYDSEESWVSRHPALGISETFGRWTGSVELGYNPENAPPQYRDSDRFLGLVREAASRWERVSGIEFEIVGTGDYSDDRAEPSEDGIVSILWKPGLDSWGTGGPSFGTFDDSLGHYPYDDGVVKLSPGRDWSDDQLVDILVHELGHLLGLGHSDDLESVMLISALSYPREDDIRAMRVLYGQPEDSFPPGQGVSEWMYEPPPESGDVSALPLFEPNTLLDQPAILTLGGYEEERIERISAETPEDEWVRVWVPIGGRSNDEPIDMPVHVVIVDPDGYRYATRTSEFSCEQPGSSCAEGTALIPTGRVKGIPGEWKIHFLDASDTDDPELLYSMDLPVEPSSGPDFNRPPLARLIALPGEDPMSPRFAVNAVDPEGDDITVKWRIPGVRFSEDNTGEVLEDKRFTQIRSVDFDSTGTHSFFVEVNDDGERYSGAGSGFQTLIRVTVELPYDGPQSVSVASTNRSQKPYTGTAFWPSPFNGVAPDPDLGLPHNNISVLYEAERKIYACARVFEGGEQSSLNGVERLDIVFDIVDYENGVIRVLGSRSFNEAGALTVGGESPDCSGIYEVDTDLYKDFLEVGSQTFDVVFEITDPASLELMLQSAVEVND